MTVMVDGANRNGVDECLVGQEDEDDDESNFHEKICLNDVWIQLGMSWLRRKDSMLQTRVLHSISSSLQLCFSKDSMASSLILPSQSKKRKKDVIIGLHTVKSTDKKAKGKFECGAAIMRSCGRPGIL